MNAILSMILSLILAFSGGSLPAVPETATTYTVDNIVLTVNDESVDLNPAIVYSAAAGAQQLQALFGIELEGDTLIPLAGELTSDGVKFSLGNGRAYSLSAETLNALSGMTEPDAATAAELDAAMGMLSDFYTAVADLYREAFTDMESNFILSEELYAYWTEISGATPETFEIDVNGVSVPVTCVELNLTAEEMFSAFDLLREKGSEAMQAYIQKMLDLMNMTSGSQYASFAELFAAMPEIDPEGAEAAMAVPFPIELTYGSKDGLFYMEEIVNTEVEGVAMDVSAVNVYQDGVNEMTMNMAMGDEELTISMGGAGAYDLNGNVDFNFDITADAMDQPVLALYFSVDRAVAEDGLAETNATLDIEAINGDVNLETGETENEKINVSIGWISGQSIEEDESLTSACELTLNVITGEEDFNAALAFDFNRTEVPFEDAFAGMELVELPADTEAESYQMLASEVFGPLSDLMTLSMEESVTEAIEIFSELAASMVVTTEEADAYYADSYAGTDDPAYLDEEYLLDDIFYEESFEYPEYTYSASDGGEADLAAAAEIYGSGFPDFSSPEGFTLDWMYVSEGYCSMDFTSDSRYVSVSFYPAYEDVTITAMQLGDDGSLTPVEGNVASVQLNTDGSVLYVDFARNGVQYSIYADGASVEEMQQYIACFMPTESDETLNCVECGNEFVFSAAEQQFYREKGFQNDPQRCPDCRAARREADDSAGSSANSGMYDVICNGCGQVTQVPFQPRGDRPVYCADCYDALRQS